MKQKILITGGSGFVGGHLVSVASEFYEVHATFWNSPVHTSDVIWHRINLTHIKTLSELMQQIQPEVIIHAAAQANLDLAEEERENTCLINVKATEHIAKLSQECGSRLIYVSSDMVFDGKCGNYSEKDAVNPINYYGETKVMAEERVRQYCSNYLITRSALVYGHPLNQSNSFSEWIYKRLRSNQNVPLFYDQFRSPILVDELAHALVECASNRLTGVLHLGGSERIDRLKFGIIFANLLKLPNKLIQKKSMKDVTTRARRPLDVSFSIHLAQENLRTKLSDCQTGLEAMINQYHYEG